MNYVTDDVINTDDGFIKNEDYTKRDTVKNAFFTKITEILMNKEYGFYFVKNQN